MDRQAGRIHEYAQAAAQGAGQILRDMLRNIAERVRRPIARSTPIVVFNPLSWPRDDVVQAHASLYGDVSLGDIADYRKGLDLVDESGASVPFVPASTPMVSVEIDKTFEHISELPPILRGRRVTFHFDVADQKTRAENCRFR